MTKHLTLLLFIGLAWGQNKVSINNLIKYGDKYFKENDDAPYNGIVFELSKQTGTKILQFSMVDGLKDGPYHEWYITGKRKTEGEFSKNDTSGNWIYWYDNGQKSSEKYYKNGILDGKIVQWYKNGQMELESTWENEEKRAESTSWYESGQKHYELNYHNINELDYEIITVWYENGQKMLELLFVSRIFPEFDDYKTLENLYISSFFKVWNEDGSPKEEHYEGELGLIPYLNLVKRYSFVPVPYPLKYELSGNFGDGRFTGELKCVSRIDSEDDFFLIKFLSSRVYRMEFHSSSSDSYYEYLDFFESGYIWTKGFEITKKPSTFNGKEIQWDEYESERFKSRETNYKNGKRDGLSIEWDFFGSKISETSWKEGQFDGHKIEWYRNGRKKSKINYENGLKNGLHTEWDEKGKILKETEYVNGKHHGKVKTWVYVEFEVDSVISLGIPYSITKDSLDVVIEKYYKNGILDGKVSHYSSNNSKILEGNYVDGRLEGVITAWYLNGEKKSESLLKNEKVISKIEWYLNGEKKSETVYKKGELISKKSWDKNGLPL